MSMTRAKDADLPTVAEDGPDRLTCVVLGDEGIGKSSLVQYFISPAKKLNPAYMPTALEEYSVEKGVKDGFGAYHRVSLDIVDTGGQKELDRLRPLCYNKADVFILCFSVVVPSSFQALMTKWVPEIRRHSFQKNIALLLVGTQADLRSNTSVLLQLSGKGLAPVSESRAIRLSRKIGAKNYIECSSINRKNIRQLFDYAMICGLQKLEKIPSLDMEESAEPGGTGNRGGPDKRKSGLIWNKENGVGRNFLSKQWRVGKCTKLKRLIFLSCLFH